MTTALGTLYTLTVFGLAIYGALGFLTLALFLRHRRENPSVPILHDDQLPPVTVQLPVYNESQVVERLIQAAARLDYPADRLQLQVLDDSTDDTTALAAKQVAALQGAGLNAELIHRTDRTGFKAGALAGGLAAATGEFIVIFDADFEPEPDFLRRTIPHFLADDKLGVVQTRWGHSNAGASTLTGMQAIALDKHFVMEQLVRHRARFYPKFNGSAGVWRRTCMEDAGGWQDDTVCEDLCLSTRAVLRGWEFRFLPEVVAPAELPTGILAYKNQQARWAEGSSQCLRKYGRQIATDRQQTPLARLYALLSMSAYSTHALFLILLLIQIPLLLANFQYPSWFFIATIAGLGQPILFVAAQQVLYRDWVLRLRHVPTLLLVAIGMAPSNTRAILRGAFGRHHTFIRTPKGAGDRYRLPLDGLFAVELALALYAAVALAMAISGSNYGPAPLLAGCVVGFGYVAASSWRDARKSQSNI
jgi:cellulose synthase/poly-beta-1,6-N-acetylglucosamine synthase-like glycosyltransferase